MIPESTGIWFVMFYMLTEPFPFIRLLSFCLDLCLPMLAPFGFLLIVMPICHMTFPFVALQ